MISDLEGRGGQQLSWSEYQCPGTFPYSAHLPLSQISYFSALLFRSSYVGMTNDHEMDI